MPTLLSVTEYCNIYSVEATFIESLEESGIIQLSVEGQAKYINEEQLADLERYRILHLELHINIEGIDAIRHLLQRQSELIREINALRDRLRLYAY